MDVVKVIKARRSVRKYKPESIPADKLEIILEAARFAPSAGNRQPWRFVVVQEASRKKAVAEADGRRGKGDYRSFANGSHAD